jgi:hypothetical protein
LQVYAIDTNSNSIASKFFTVERGDTFNINLYLPTITSSNNAPVLSNTGLWRDGERMRCKTNFYDKDLDWNGAFFKVWTASGDSSHPIIESFSHNAFTTNCNPADAPCTVYQAYSAADVNRNLFLNECGSSNDCYAQLYFDKPVSISGIETLYCSVTLSDLNGNSATALSQITVTTSKTYDIYASCKSYALVDGKQEPVIFTAQDVGYAECEVGVGNVLVPDRNFNVLLLDGTPLQLLYAAANTDDYGETTYVFKADASTTMFDYCAKHSTDGETCDGKTTMPVHITHPIYGSYDTSMDISIILTGGRAGGEDVTTAFTEAKFGGFIDFLTGLFFGLFTDPVKTVQDNFFFFILLFAAIIILAPLLIAANAAANKFRGGGQSVYYRNRR